MRLHRVPLTIIYNRDAKYTAKYWDRLHEKLGTQLTFSMALSQTD